MDSSRYKGSQRLIHLAQRLGHREFLPNGRPAVAPLPDESAGKQISDSSGRSGKRNRAAVLICIFEGEGGELRVILTKRSSKLASHPGEVSLPGGKTEEGDEDHIQTALREAKEEIGLDPSLVEIVAVLQPFMSMKNIAVVPVIAVLFNKKAFQPVANAAEVEAIFDVPLEMFLKDENCRSEEKEWQGNKYQFHFFEYKVGQNKYVIWALTASILIATAALVYQRPPNFPLRNPRSWNRNHHSKY